MTRQQAQEILSIYRPGTADAEDPSFSEALLLCESDPELKAWFDDHCATYAILRGKFKEIAVPTDLKQRVLSHSATEKSKIIAPSFWTGTRLLAAAATVALVGGLLLLWLQPPAQTEFQAFRNSMLGKAFRTYSMDLETSDPERVRTHLARRNAPADYTLPPGTRNAKLVGCVASNWRGKPVSMICFRSGRSSADPSQDLWLFVIDGSVTAGPVSETPSVQTTDGVTTASWNRNGKTYLLVMEADEKELRKFL